MTGHEIRFPASVHRVQTLVDGGVRVTLDLPETEIPRMAMLAECQREGIPLMFVARMDEQPRRRECAGDGRAGR